MSLYVKLWTDILGDAKLMSAARKGARELQLLPWLFAFAKAAQDGGRLTINGEPADPIDIAAQIPRCTAKRVAQALVEATAIGILEPDDDGALRFAAWERRAGEKPSDAPSAVRERVRRHRAKGKAVTHGNALQGEDGNATEEEEEVETEQERETETSSSARDGESAVARQLPTDSDRNALTALLVRVPHAETWLAEMRASLDGMPGHVRTTAAQLGQAVREYVGNGAAQHPNLRQFRRYLEQAAAPAVPSIPSAARVPARNPGAQQVANILGGRR